MTSPPVVTPASDSRKQRGNDKGLSPGDKEDTVRRPRFGVQMFPYHNAAHNPTLQFEDDLQLVQLLDRLGFDEAWCGEHHSTGPLMLADRAL